MFKESREILGTLIAIESESKDIGFCWELLESFEKKYSRFTDSYLNELNSNLGKWQAVDAETYFLFEQAEKLLVTTGGVFDISQKQTLEGLGYGESEHVATTTHLRAFKLRDGQLYLRKTVEFGGFGKGYAIDLLVKCLDGMGVKRYCIDAGGDLFARRGGGEPWRIVLEHPEDSSLAIGELELDGQALACSSANRRRWEGGHHLIDPRTGSPGQGVKASWVLADSGLLADAWATACFIEPKLAEGKEALVVGEKIVGRKDWLYKYQ